WPKIFSTMYLSQKKSISMVKCNGRSGYPTWRDPNSLILLQVFVVPTLVLLFLARLILLVIGGITILYDVELLLVVVVIESDTRGLAAAGTLWLGAPGDREGGDVGAGVGLRAGESCSIV